MKKVLLLAFSILLMVSCDKKQEPKTTTVPQQKNTTIDLALAKQQEQLARTKKIIDSVLYKKDSLLQVVASTQQTLERLNDSKNEGGIDNETLKLDQLSGQKSNFEEEINFRKKEIALADKKLELYNEEKTMYQEHKKALYSRGAKPVALAKVDSLLSNISNKIANLNKVSEEASKALSQTQEQATAVSKEQEVISNKISSAYISKAVFEDFAKNEKTTIDHQIQLLDSVIRSHKTSAAANAVQNTITKDSLTSNLQLTGKNKATLISSTNKEDRLNYAFGAVGIVIVTFGLFYFIGKKKKTATPTTFN